MSDLNLLLALAAVGVLAAAVGCMVAAVRKRDVPCAHDMIGDVCWKCGWRSEGERGE